MNKNTKINCPDCGSQIDVNEILKHQLEASLRNEFKQKQNALVETQKQRQIDFQKQITDFEIEKKESKKLFEKQIEAERKVVTEKIEKKLKNQLLSENEDRFKSMQNELAEKSEKVKELFKKEAEIERLKREKDEVQDQAKLSAQKDLSKQLQSEREKIKRQAEEATEFKLKELQKQLEDQKKLTDDMKRKQDQGSMQLQGEVMELAIEQWLANQFPLDTIDEIKKGAKGADCLQTVNTREQANCGTIYYESKRTKKFESGWIEKFKNDIRDKGATVGV